MDEFRKKAMYSEEKLTELDPFDQPLEQSGLSWRAHQMNPEQRD
jgi:hypothetical protein